MILQYRTGEVESQTFKLQNHWKKEATDQDVSQRLGGRAWISSSDTVNPNICGVNNDIWGVLIFNGIKHVVT